MRGALVVGIDHHEAISPLSGCVNDAHAVRAMLDRNSDGSVNFGCRLMTGRGTGDLIARTALKEVMRELFAGDGEVAMFYFAGPGFIETAGGYPCAGDCRTGDDGLSIAGTHPTHGRLAELADGMTVLSASTVEQYASEANGSGGLYPPLC